MTVTWESHNFGIHNLPGDGEGSAVSSISTAEASLGPDRLEELNGIAAWVLNQDRLAAGAGDDLVAEPDSGLPQLVDGRAEIGDFEGEPIPAARLGFAAVWHGLRAATRSAWTVEHEPQVTPGQHGKRCRRMHFLVEPEVLAIERDGGVDVVDDLPHLSGSHARQRTRFK